MLNDAARLQMAEGLLTLAEHSSEAEIRNSLSRMYYAVYHVAITRVGSMAHAEFKSALNKIEPGLGDRFDKLQLLRVRADYWPEFRIENEEYRKQMESARDLYEHLLTLEERS